MNTNNKNRKVDIKISVELDEKNVPQSIKWSSDDPPSNGKESGAKAFFLTIFDEEQLETLQIDLWNQKFEVGEINRMVYYSIKGMAETYFKATRDDRISNDLARFAQYLGEELGIILKN